MKFSQTIPIMQGIAQFSTVFCNEPSFQLSVSCRDVDPTLTLKLYSRWRDLSVCRQACLARAIANTNNEEQGTHTCICCAGYNKTAAWALTDPGPLPLHKLDLHWEKKQYDGTIWFRTNRNDQFTHNFLELSMSTHAWLTAFLQMVRQPL